MLQRTGLTQAEVARRIGEDRDWVNNRVRGRTQLAAVDIPRLAHAIGVRPRDFFDDDEESYEFAAVAHGRVADAAGPYLTGWERMRDHDRRLFVDVVEALGRWRDRALVRRRESA